VQPPPFEPHGQADDDRDHADDDRPEASHVPAVAAAGDTPREHPGDDGYANSLAVTLINLGMVYQDKKEVKLAAKAYLDGAAIAHRSPARRSMTPGAVVDRAGFTAG
jgi:hypothetical protein